MLNIKFSLLPIALPLSIYGLLYECVEQQVHSIMRKRLLFLILKTDGDLSPYILILLVTEVLIY